jgi:hypothetical protein
MKSRRTLVSQLRTTPNLWTAAACALAGIMFVTEIVAMGQPSYVMELFGLESVDCVLRISELRPSRYGCNGGAVEVAGR